MKRNIKVAAALGALLFAAMAPWSASKANGVSVRISTPEFGIRIGAPHYPVYRPAPVYYPVPVHTPRHYRYAPPPLVYAPPPRYFAPPYFVGGYRGDGDYRRWQHRHWSQHGNHRDDRRGDR